MNEKKLFLLDAMALVYRAYYALIRSPRITGKGRNTNAQFGFTNTLVDLINRERPSHLAVVFDTHAPTERDVLFAAYKANRQETPEDILSAVPDIQRIVRGFNLPCLEVDGYEADDIIGTLAWEACDLGYEVFMVTPDKDYGQLVRECIKIYKPGYQGGSVEIMGPREVCARWNIQRVDQVVDMLGLMGDAVDNIPGIPGVGEKTAAKLLAEYDNLENVVANADKIKGSLGDKVRNGSESALLSKRLAKIITDVPVKFHEEDFRVKDWNREALEEVFTELEFKALGRRILGEGFAPAISTKPVAVDLFGNPLAQPATVRIAAETLITVETPEEAPAGEARTIENTPHHYTLVGADGIDALVATLMPVPEISFDTETTGIDATIAELVGLSFSTEPHAGWYVPVPDSREEALALLARFGPLFARTDVTWIGQNLKYDLLMLKRYGVPFPGKTFDTMLAHYVIEPEGKRNMDALSLKYLSYTPVSIETLIGKKGKGQLTMRQVDVEQVKEYAAEDADVTLQLKHYFDPKLDSCKVREIFDRVENPLIPVLVDMEHEGVGVDTNFLREYSKELDRDIRQAEESVYRHAGLEFNLGSPKQLGEVLFDKMGLDPTAKKTKTGQYATGEDVLQKLRASHEIVDGILVYRELTKLKGTYVDALPELLHPGTGRVHTSFNQTVAVTGRLSSNNPNLQNIPVRTERGREIRRAFVSRGPGWKLLSADYSQIELRIIAAISGDTEMISAFKGDKDIHTATAAKVYGVPEAEVSSAQRRNAKAVNFGIIYGQSAFGLAGVLGIPRAEAKTMIEQYFIQYPSIKHYMDEQIKFARSHQYVQTLMGRKRYLRDINSPNQTVRGFAERNAINMPVQGTAADMIKLAMIAVREAMLREGVRSRMILQVHDELIFDVPEDEAELMKALIVREMEGAMTLPHEVPVRAEAGLGDNWLEAH